MNRAGVVRIAVLYLFDFFNAAPPSGQSSGAKIKPQTFSRGALNCQLVTNLAAMTQSSFFWLVPDMRVNAY